MTFMINDEKILIYFCIKLIVEIDNYSIYKDKLSIIII